MGDFGFATKVEPPKSVDAKQRAKTVLGTPLWMAPEIHRREQYSSAVDIWAMGIVALEMAEVSVVGVAVLMALTVECSAGCSSIQGNEQRGDS